MRCQHPHGTKSIAKLGETQGHYLFIMKKEDMCFNSKVKHVSIYVESMCIDETICMLQNEKESYIDISWTTTTHAADIKTYSPVVSSETFQAEPI